MTDKKLPPEGKRIVFCPDDMIQKYNKGYERFLDIMELKKAFFSDESRWGDFGDEFKDKLPALKKASGLNLITPETSVWLICMYLEKPLDGGTPAP